MTVNKYDKFNVHDPSPFIVEYTSFAGYDNSPMEFYYNCSTANIKDIAKSEKLIYKSKIDKTSHNITKHPYSNPTIQKLNVQSHSNIELALLLLNIVILMITLITLCCVFSKFNEII